MGYSIQAVAKLTGIPALTLRNWERRYGFPKPTRLPNGYRAYSVHDIELLKKIAAHLKEGSRIHVVMAELQERKDVAPVPVPLEKESGFASTHESRDELFAALAGFESGRAQFLASVLAAKLTTFQLLEMVYLPILVRTGKEWEKDRLSPAQEHFISAFIRMQLLALLNTIAPPQDGARKRAIFCTPEHELHEGGLLYLAVRLKFRGWEVIYLGPNCPLSDVLEASKKAKPDAICISISDSKLLPEVVRSVGKSPIPVCIGGPAVREARPNVPKGSLIHFSTSDGPAGADFIELATGGTSGPDTA